MLYTLVAFAIILGILVFVHELGHFLVARLFGIKAEEFGFGFPPRIGGIVYNNKLKKWEFVKGNQALKRKNTIYSINWIPLGGFVKIFGEDGEKKSGDKKNPSNFTSHPVWQRILVLFAGVGMNFITAVLILSLGFFVGIPEAVEDVSRDNLKNPKIHVIEILPGSPAFKMGLKPGDEIIKIKGGETEIIIENVSQVTEFLKEKAGTEILIEIKRGDSIYRFKGIPRENPPQGEGALGIALTKTAIVSYPLIDSFKQGFWGTCKMTQTMFKAFGKIIQELIFQGRTEAEVSGPVGIVILTNQVAEMGFSYLIQFAAILSINLAIINIIPFPALDGGRILFLIIEKIKRRPVSPQLEQKIHFSGFYFLIALMVFITIKDVFKFQDKFIIIFEKFRNIFH